MTARLLNLLFVLAAGPATMAHANNMHIACKRLCQNESECLHKCVNQSELMELKADFIHAVADFTSSADERMKILRSGADIQTLSLCRETGWSMDNILICLRSYPTPEAVKACKKLSPLQDEQVRCIRMGKTSAEIEACSLLVPGPEQRLICLQMALTAEETRTCRSEKKDSSSRMNCLLEAEAHRTQETRSWEQEVTLRDQQEKKERSPASTPAKHEK